MSTSSLFPNLISVTFPEALVINKWPNVYKYIILLRRKCYTMQGWKERADAWISHALSIWISQDYF